jgi:hypothetical protein
MNISRPFVTRTIIFVCAAATVAVATTFLVRLNSHSQTNESTGAAGSIRGSSTARTTAVTPKASSINTAKPVADSDWDSKFANTKSYFAFVKQASLAALKGDGSAARDISTALTLCLPYRMYGSSPNPEEAFKVHLDAQAYAPQWLRDKTQKEFKMCKGFLTGEDVFANLPERTGGYNSIRYWTDLAVADRDPIALSSQAAVTVNASVRVTSPEAKAESLQSVQVMVDQVIESSNPEAIFRIGLVLSDGRVSIDPVRGFAISLAACDMGYNCSSSNAELFGACAIQGDCAENLTYADMVRRAAGEDGYARAYAQAQEFEQALARGDTNAVHQLAQLIQPHR